MIIINTIGAFALVAVSLTFPSRRDPTGLMVTIAVTSAWILFSAIFSLRLVKVRKAIAARLEKESQEKENKADW